MQKCSSILIRIIAVLLLILVTLVIVDFRNFRRRKVTQAILKKEEVCQVDSEKTAEEYISEENPKQLCKLFKTMKLLLLYELELKYADQYKSKEESVKRHREKVSRKINKKYLRLFRLIRELQFEFTRRRFKYLTKSLNLYLKDIIVNKMDEEEGKAMVGVQKGMIHELGSMFLNVLIHREYYSQDEAIMFIKTRQNLREINRIMSSFHRNPSSSNHSSFQGPQRPCNGVFGSKEQGSKCNFDFSKSDLNHSRLSGRIVRVLATKKPLTQSHLLRHVRDAGKQTFTSHDPSTLNTSRTWRTVDFFATDDSDGLGTLVDMYPDYFLSKRPITSVDQIPTVPEHIILNLQENPDRHGYTHKSLLKRWRDNMNMTDEEFKYAIDTFRGNKTDSDIQRDYQEQMDVFLPGFEAEIRKHSDLCNLTVLEATKKTQKKKVRTGTPPLSRPANFTRHFFNGSRPANFSRWTKKKNSTPLVRTKFIKVKKNKTTKEINIRIRRDASVTADWRPTDWIRHLTTPRRPSTKFVYGKKFNKLLPERYHNADVLTISSEEKTKIGGKTRRRSTAWNFLNYRMRTTGVYREPDTAEIANRWRRRFVVRRQYDSVTSMNWNYFVGNETDKSHLERKLASENYGSMLDTTTMSDSDYLKTHSLPPEFWPAPLDFNEQRFHELMYESFYDQAGFTTAPVWFNSTKKTKHPKKLLKYTTPTRRLSATQSPNTTINFVKLLIKQKLKEYASSKLRTTVTRGTFPYYIFNASYITKFNDLFHHFEYAKDGRDLVNNTNKELEKNLDNMGAYFKDLGAHLNELEEVMRRDVKISADPKHGQENRTTGFVRYAEKTKGGFREKFEISTHINPEDLTFSTPRSAEFYEKTHNPFIEDFVHFAKDIKNFEQEMTGPKAKARFMDILNEGRKSGEKLNSSEVWRIIRENNPNYTTNSEAQKEEIKIEEIHDKEEKDGKKVDGKVDKKDDAKGGKKGKKKSKKCTDDAFAEDSFYRDDDSGDIRNNVRKQNLRLQESTTELESIPSEEVEEFRKAWVRPMEEFDGNITHRKLNRYQCVDCSRNNSQYYRTTNFTEYVEHYRVHHFDMYNRSKYTEDVAWKLGYPSPYQCEFCKFYEPYDNDVCYDHYEKDHPDENPHDVYAQVFKMRRFYLEFRKKWPHNNSQELKEHVGDLFNTPRYAGGTTECTACKFHHPTPRDPVFFSQFYVLPTTEDTNENYEDLIANRSDPLPSNETRIRIPKWLQRDVDKYRGASMPSGELLKNLSRGIFNSRSGENDTSEFKSDYYGSCDYRSKTIETGEDIWGSSCEDRMT